MYVRGRTKSQQTRTRPVYTRPTATWVSGSESTVGERTGLHDVAGSHRKLYHGMVVSQAAHRTCGLAGGAWAGTVLARLGRALERLEPAHALSTTHRLDASLDLVEVTLLLEDRVYVVDALRRRAQNVVSGGKHSTQATPSSGERALGGDVRRMAC